MKSIQFIFKGSWKENIFVAGCNKFSILGIKEKCHRSFLEISKSDFGEEDKGKMLSNKEQLLWNLKVQFYHIWTKSCFSNFVEHENDWNREVLWKDNTVFNTGVKEKIWVRKS